MHVLYNVFRLSLLFCGMMFPVYAWGNELFNSLQKYIDKGACPFECCTYRQWKVTRQTVLYDNPDSSKPIGLLKAGESVRGITGEVWSIPVEMTALHDIPQSNVKSGDVFYVLNYAGEGNWKVWHKGRFSSVHQEDVKLRKPKCEWWVKIVDSNGNMGWALSDGNFSGQDACG
ncbi:MAG: hypothetical protein ACP59X_14200 [Solidesulfovibrio sp. DCME]|uniref:hypothetical protein n=1 Tax=Solidesulfovibrio sp. DCME TaxID=3447380 RepID=UPI003D0DBF94